MTDGFMYKVGSFVREKSTSLVWSVARIEPKAVVLARSDNLGDHAAEVSNDSFVEQFESCQPPKKRNPAFVEGAMVHSVTRNTAVKVLEIDEEYWKVRLGLPPNWDHTWLTSLDNEAYLPTFVTDSSALKLDAAPELPPRQQWEADLVIKCLMEQSEPLKRALSSGWQPGPLVPGRPGTRDPEWTASMVKGGHTIDGHGTSRAEAVADLANKLTAQADAPVGLRVNLTVPQAPGLDWARVVRWNVGPGEPFAQDAIVAILSSNLGDIELLAPLHGFLESYVAADPEFDRLPGTLVGTMVVGTPNRDGLKTTIYNLPEPEAPPADGSEEAKEEKTLLDRLGRILPGWNITPFVKVKVPHTSTLTYQIRANLGGRYAGGAGSTRQQAAQNLVKSCVGQDQGNAPVFVDESDPEAMMNDLSFLHMPKALEELFGDGPPSKEAVLEAMIEIANKAYRKAACDALVEMGDHSAVSTNWGEDATYHELMKQVFRNYKEQGERFRFIGAAEAAEVIFGHDFATKLRNEDLPHVEVLKAINDQAQKVAKDHARAGRESAMKQVRDEIKRHEAGVRTMEKNHASLVKNASDVAESIGRRKVELTALYDILDDMGKVQ